MAKVAETYQGSARCVVVGGEGWHEGVKGIVASRIVNTLSASRPCCSPSRTAIARGSGR